MSELKIYNTLTREKETFVPLEPGKVGMYCCGPTVYNHQHIGNMRSFTFEDILRRTLEKCGYEVKHVMNITDVGHLQSDADEGEDKMSLAAAREQKSPWDIARHYEEEFFRFEAEMNIRRPTIVSRATEHIAEMIAMVERLIKNGYAYESGGNVYFEVAKFDRYTEFARLRLEAHNQTDRVERDDKKRNQADFALWFSQSKFPNQIMKWDSPWGVGFPGWHIECSAMASKYLGERFDIHCGGIDHIPVHHTNEIAQSECCFGHKWVNVWMHNEFLNDATGKMSKSKGEFLTLDVLTREGYDPLDYRYLLLTTHYRGSITFTYEALTNAKNTLKGLRDRIAEWKEKGGTAEEVPTMAEYRAKFDAAMRDDLHTPIALTVLWAVVKDEILSPAQKLALVLEFDEIFGLRLGEAQKKIEHLLSDRQASLLKEREAARSAKNWKESDRIRDALLKEGIALEDGPAGTTWRYVGK